MWAQAAWPEKPTAGAARIKKKRQIKSWLNSLNWKKKNKINTMLGWAELGQILKDIVCEKNI
jgi:hypothetical protein